MSEDILQELLLAQKENNELLKQLIGTDEAKQHALKKIGEVSITSAGQAVTNVKLIVPQEMQDISFFAVETNSKDLLLKRASIGLSIDGVTYFEQDTPAKTFFFPEYNEQRMLDLREFSNDGKPIKSVNKQITVSVTDDASVTLPIFAAYKVYFFIKGKSENKG